MIPNWLYISQLTGNSGTTNITVSADTNNELFERLSILNVITNNIGLDDVVVINQEKKKEYLTFEILSAGTIVWKTRNTAITKIIDYSLDNGSTWTSITSSTEGTSFNVSAGDIVKFRGDNAEYQYSSFSGTTAVFNVYGNIMSLLDSQNFANKTSLDSGYTFDGLFYCCTGLTDASELLLPATTLAERCYAYMFYGCHSLETAPELPATTLTEYCYQSMFYGCNSLVNASSILPATTLAQNCYEHMFRECTSLVTAPELPATTLASNCYRSMFVECTSLETAPELPATNLTDYCYFNMFRNCTSLNYIKCLATDISAYICTGNWVMGVSSSGTFVRESGMTDWEINSNNGIPIGWTVIPPMPIPVLNNLTFEIISAGTINWRNTNSNSSAVKTIEYNINGSGWTSFSISTSNPLSINVSVGDYVLFRGNNAEYRYFEFRYSTASFKVKGNIMSLLDSQNFESKTTLDSAYTFSYLFWYCTGLTDASELVLPATTLKDYCYEEMFKNCSSLVSAPTLPASALTNQCYYAMFEGCSSLTTAPELPATTLAYACYGFMFQGCTSLTTAPELPATTLARQCYEEMFTDCTALTTAPILSAATLVDGCYYAMFEGCTNLNYIKCLATDISADYSTLDWVNNVAPSGTFVKNSSATWTTTGNNGIPTNWTVQNV